MLPDERLVETGSFESDALVRQSLDCLLGIAPRDAGLGLLSGRGLSDGSFPGVKTPGLSSCRPSGAGARRKYCDRDRGCLTPWFKLPRLRKH